MAEDTSNAGGEAAVDTSNTGDEGAAEAPAEGAVSDETGSVTQDEITQALGPKYKTVTPVAESEETKENEEEAAEDVEQEAEAEEEVTPAAKPETQVVTDSNEPSFAFEVKDANDVTFKIEPGDSIEDILKDFEPKNNGQIISILDQLREAKDAKAQYESNQQAEAAEAATAERITAIQDGWSAEIKALQADKRIPVTNKGTDNSRVAEVYEFMAKENDARIKDNRPTIGSFTDALDLLEVRERPPSCD